MSQEGDCEAEGLGGRLPGAGYTDRSPWATTWAVALLPRPDSTHLTGSWARTGGGLGTPGRRSHRSSPGRDLHPVSVASVLPPTPQPCRALT